MKSSMSTGNQDQRVGGYLIALTTFTAGVIAVYIDAFELLSEFVEEHDAWELDEFLIALMIAGIGALVLLFRRASQLRAEIQRRELSEEHAVKLARHDPLTGLANRRVFEATLKATLAATRTTSTECAVFLIDLDRFKPINDLYGHNVGDAVLMELALRLGVILDGKGTVARMGGDEFACVIQFPSGSDLPSELARQIVSSLSNPVHIGELQLETGASVGISCAPRDGQSSSDLLHGADLAMYESKRNGRGSYRFFDAKMDRNLRERTSLENDLRKAVANGEIIPFFQPVMDLAEGTIVGFEALARWPHPSRGLIPPDTFIPIAEDLGVLDQITNSMLRLSCLAAREWPASIWLSINLSPSQLTDIWLASRLLGILTETGLVAGRFIVEVTGIAAVDDLKRAQATFVSLQNAGVRIALDDFGTGYSSLNHLHELKFDLLKIDRSFVRSLDSPERSKILSVVAGLGRAFGMPVTAEGVETQAEANALRLLGCEQAQGFLFGKAMSAADALELLQHKEARAGLVRSL